MKSMENNIIEAKKSLQENEEFRNSFGTMDRKGTRKWVYPKKTSGKFTKWRTIVSWFLLAFLTIIPFIKLPNGNPVFKFDFLNTEFYLFGFPFFISDFFLLAIGMITTVVFILVFTSVFGRIFCGWICPQTIFMEMVFRKIEYAIEGDRAKQMRLDNQLWNQEKILKKTSKWFAFAIVSFFITNIVFSYVMGSDKLVQQITEGPVKHSGTFITFLIFSALFYFVFAWFREQACTLVCPYGRLQGVLIDKKSIVVAYDFKRGESSAGRATFRKNEDRKAVSKGDCIDCKQCVVVCPTGIDIRNGLQMECVGCTACIDACDEVMEKIHLPKGLIRYTSEENIEEEKRFSFTPKMVLFSSGLIALSGIIFSFLFVRNDVEAKFLQVPGRNFKVIENNVENYYQYNLFNKTNDLKLIKIRLSSHKGEKINVIGNSQTIELPKGKLKQGTISVTIPQTELNSYKEKVVFEITDQNGKSIDTYTTSFMAPY